MDLLETISLILVENNSTISNTNVIITKENKEENNKDLSDKEKDESRKQIENKIKVMDCLAEFGEEDKYIAFDSGMFNDIFKGYVELLTEDVEEKTKKTLRNRSRVILDEYNSKEAEDKYLGK